MTDADTARLVEFSEARAYARLVDSAATNLREHYGLSIHRIGSAYALVAPGVRDSLILNRIIGLGLCEPVTADVIEEADKLYLGNGIETYAAEMSPLGALSNLADDMSLLGFMPFRQTTMLYRSSQPMSAAVSGLEVRRVGRGHADAFVAICCTVFGFGAPFPGLLRATFERSDWQHWLAFEDETPVASAMTAIFDDGVAWIGWVGTLSSHRGRGAQNAITGAQLQASYEAGAQWVTLETATGTKRRPSQSLRNYLRLGWTAAYDRMIFLRKITQQQRRPI